MVVTSKVDGALHSAVAPSVVVVPATRSVTSVYFLPVQAGMAGVAAVVGAEGQDPYIVRAGLDEVHLKVQPRARGGIVGGELRSGTCMPTSPVKPPVGPTCSH